MTERSPPPIPTLSRPYPLSDAKTATARVKAVTVWIQHAMMVSYGADNRVWVFPHDPKVGG